MTSVAGVGASTASVLGAGPGASPRATLQQLRVGALPLHIAKKVLQTHHYLHSFPGGTSLAFGAFLGERLVGAVTLGAGPANAFRLVEGAGRGDCLALTRFWLADELPANGASRILGIITRTLRKHTKLKFLISYADPSQCHVGTIYQATGWLYTGLSQPTSLYDIGNGKVSHSRSFSQVYGTRSMRHFSQEGLKILQIPAAPKHRYVLFLDRGWTDRLRVPVLSYPKKKEASA